MGENVAEIVLNIHSHSLLAGLVDGMSLLRISEICVYIDGVNVCV